MKLFCLALALVVCATSASEESTMERMERRMAEMEKELQKYRNMVAEVRASPSPTRGGLVCAARDLST